MTTPEPESLTGSDLSPQALQTVHTIERAMHEGGAHSLPELVEIIQTLSSKAKDISVQDLADKIEKHVEVMARVISAANTFGYNPGAAEIGTVRQAIQVIGFERIRTLVTSLILVRHAARSDASHVEQKQTALQAVCSGFLAQSIAGNTYNTDPEQAFVTASLRHLGRLLLCNYLREEYLTAMALASDRPENTAFREVLGLTPLELSREILTRTGFPKKIVLALRTKEEIAGSKLPQETITLSAVTELSEQITNLALDRSRSSEDFLARAELIAHAYDKSIQLSRDQIKEVLGSIGERMDQFTNALGFGAVAKEAVSTLRWRSGRVKESTLTPPANKPGTPVPPINGLGKGADGNTKTAEDSNCEIGGKHWRDGLVSLTNCLGETTINLSEINSLALDFIRKGFNAQEAVLMQLDSDQRNYTVTHGVGAVFKQIRNDRAAKKDERTVLGVCISRKENVLIHNTDDPKTLAYLPAWSRREQGWGSFVAIPLYDPNSCFALMIVAWHKPMQINISPENSRLLRSIISTIAAARRIARV